MTENLIKYFIKVDEFKFSKYFSEPFGLLIFTWFI